MLCGEGSGVGEMREFHCRLKAVGVFAERGLVKKMMELLEELLEKSYQYREVRKMK